MPDANNTGEDWTDREWPFPRNLTSVTYLLPLPRNKILCMYKADGCDYPNGVASAALTYLSGECATRPAEKARN